MNKIFTQFTKIVITSLIVVSFALFPVIAQGTSTENTKLSGVTVSPAISTVNPGKSYELKITNNEEKELEFLIEGSYFKVGTEDRIIPLTRAESKNLAAISTHLVPKVSKVKIKPGQTITTSVSYKKMDEKFLVGVLIGLADKTAGQVGANAKVASVIIDKSTAPADLEKVDISVNVKPGLGFSNFNLGGNSLIDIQITNNSSKFIDLSGDILVYDGEKRIGKIIISDKIDLTIAPGATSNGELEYIDKRDIFAQFGSLRFESNVNLNGTPRKNMANTFNFPLLLIILSLLAIVVIIGGVWWAVRKFVFKRQAQVK